MKIHTQLKPNLSQENSNEIASGWVEIEDCIKFPIKMRRYINKDGKKEWFISYPQRRTENGYVPVVSVHDKQMQEEIRNSVFKAYQEAVFGFLNTVPVEEVKVTLYQTKETGAKVNLKGIATVKMSGLTIHGVLVKESKNGLFIQMPQHKSGNTYHDTVYGTNSSMQMAIREAVLEEYQKEAAKKKLQRPPEAEKKQVQPEQEAPKSEPGTENPGKKPEVRQKFSPTEGMHRFIEAYREGNPDKMMSVLANTELKVSPAEFTKNNQAVDFQEAVLKAGDYALEVLFVNLYHPMQEAPPEKAIHQRISVNIYEKNTMIGMQVLEERQSMSLAGAKKNYEDALALWKRLTNQNRIYFEKALLNEAQDVKHSAPQGPKL